MMRFCKVIIFFLFLFLSSSVVAYADQSEFIKKLAFVSNEQGRWQIFLINQDGTRREPLIKLDKNQFGYPISTGGASWSPDGTAITFNGNVTSLGLAIYTINSDGSGLKQLTNLKNTGEYNISPTWSPDGKKIAFVSERDGGREIYVMNTDGSLQTRLTTALGNADSPAWSPDGSQIAFVSRRDGRDQIYLMKPDGSNQYKLINSDTFDRNPTWSPDSSSIAFDRGGEIFVVTFDGKLRKVFSLTSSMGGFDPSWSPDGLALAFTGDGIFRTEIFTVEISTGKLTRVTENTFDDQQANWQPYSQKEVQVILEYKAAAERKMKQEAEAKAASKAEADRLAAEKSAAELKAKQEVEAKAATTKKTTITCVKGKLTKKVTSVKPKCPSGYKVKM